MAEPSCNNRTGQQLGMQVLHCAWPIPNFESRVGWGVMVACQYHECGCWWSLDWWGTVAHIHMCTYCFLGQDELLWLSCWVFSFLSCVRFLFLVIYTLFIWFLLTGKLVIIEFKFRLYLRCIANICKRRCLTFYPCERICANPASSNGTYGL